MDGASRHGRAAGGTSRRPEAPRRVVSTRSRGTAMLRREQREIAAAHGRRAEQVGRRNGRPPRREREARKAAHLGGRPRHALQLRSRRRAAGSARLATLTSARSLLRLFS